MEGVGWEGTTVSLWVINFMSTWKRKKRPEDRSWSNQISLARLGGSWADS